MRWLIGPLDRLEGDLFRHTTRRDPARLLPERGLVPPRVLPVVRTHVEGVVHRDGPDPRQRAVRLAVLTERSYVEVIGSGDFASSSLDHADTLLSMLIVTCSFNDRVP